MFISWFSNGVTQGLAGPRRFSGVRDFRFFNMVSYFLQMMLCDIHSVEDFSYVIAVANNHIDAWLPFIR